MKSKFSYIAIINKLFTLKDEKYKAFSQKLINKDEQLIGVRIPDLRVMAKEISQSNLEEYISSYQGTYFEEKMLLGMSLGYTNDIKLYDKYLWFFSQKITNWSICDSSASTFKLIKKEQNHFYPIVLKMLRSNQEFQIRFGIILLMDYYLIPNYLEEVISEVINIHSDYYYVKMAIAWLLCECYIKYPLKIDDFINSKYLDAFTLNKTISKINDSFRVNEKQKKMLKKRRVSSSLNTMDK